MPANDAALQAALTQLTDSSQGLIHFRALTTRSLGAQIELELRHSPNPVYDFELARKGEAPFHTIAYTLAVDGTRRVATRAEALGQGLAVDSGRLFQWNPFLLIFDYVGNRFMAVSAAKLFGAFAHEIAVRPRASSETSTFSLTPSFINRTISMYATIPETDIWHCSLAPNELTLEALENGLARMRGETIARAAEFPAITAAIRSRIESAPPVLRGEATRAEAAAKPLLSGAAPEEEDIKVPLRIWRMILRAIRSSPAVILVGPPGTGKTALLRKAIAELRQSPIFVGAGEILAEPIWATPDESWTARDLVGGETVAHGEITFRAGWVLQAIEANRWLVLDEANRADMDRIFGGLLTWLSGGTVTVGMESTSETAKIIQLGWKIGDNERVEVSPTGSTNLRGAISYLAGEKWRLLGTYNALDAQRVFRFGAALGRRFVRIPIPAAEPEMFAQAISDQAGDLSPEVRKGVEQLYTVHFESDATRLGPALFLAMCRYLRTVQNEAAETEAAEEKRSMPLEVPLGAEAGQGEIGASRNTKQALAEAYVIHVGTWLVLAPVRIRA